MAKSNTSGSRQNRETSRNSINNGKRASPTVEKGKDGKKKKVNGIVRREARINDPAQLASDTSDEEDDIKSNSCVRGMMKTSISYTEIAATTVTEDNTTNHDSGKARTQASEQASEVAQQQEENGNTDDAPEKIMEKIKYLEKELVEVRKENELMKGNESLIDKSIGVGGKEASVGCLSGLTQVEMDVIEKQTEVFVREKIFPHMKFLPSGNQGSMWAEIFKVMKATNMICQPKDTAWEQLFVDCQPFIRSYMAQMRNNIQLNCKKKFIGKRMRKGKPCMCQEDI